MNTLQVIYMLTQSPEFDKIVLEEREGYLTKLAAIEVLSGIGDKEWSYSKWLNQGIIFIY